MPKKTPKLSKKDARKALDMERDAILKDIGDDESEHWRTGKHFANIVERKLAMLAGYRTSAEFVNAELRPHCQEISKSTLQVYARVARAFDEATTTRFGTSKLDKLLTLRTLLDQKDRPKDVAGYEVKTGDGKDWPVTKKFSDCSVADLSAAIRLLKPSGKSLDKISDKDAVQAATSLQAVVDARLGDSPFTVDLEERSGHLYFHLRFIPVDELEVVLKAMLGQQ